MLLSTVLLINAIFAATERKPAPLSVTYIECDEETGESSFRYKLTQALEGSSSILVVPEDSPKPHFSLDVSCITDSRPTYTGLKTQVTMLFVSTVLAYSGPKISGLSTRDGKTPRILVTHMLGGCTLGSLDGCVDAIVAATDRSMREAE